MKPNKFIWLCLLIVLTQTACDKARVFEENVNIPDNVWNRNNKVRFDVAVDDLSAKYNFYINVRNAGNYPYSNLFIFMDTKYPDGFVSRDTLECILADESGTWLGDGSGDIFDNQIMFRKNFSMKQKGNYVFVLEQGMRVENLPLIMDVGIRLEKAGTEN
jgi:gliding motility-associated lipoprotein GldH